MKTHMRDLLTTHLTFIAAVGALLLLALPAAAVMSVDSVTVDDGSGGAVTPGSPGTNPTMLLTITVGTYTVSVDDLVTGVTGGTDNGSGSYPPANADDFDLYDVATKMDPLDWTFLGGASWTDTNGDNPDFFIFESGGNDDGNVQPILNAAGTLFGQSVSYSSSDWGGTGYWDSLKESHGICFKVTDLKDDSGAWLTNSSVIYGLRINDDGIDPGCICAMVPEPSTMILGGLGILGLLLRLRRRPRA